MGSPHLASRRWIYEQYDHMVMADTVQRPGGDAAVVRVHGTQKGLAISCDVTPRYCAADPQEGAKQAIAECWRNLTATGAVPLAITDCMNFGNPQRPEIMGEFVGAVEGMARGLHRARLPGRVRQCVALQRDHGRRYSADARYRRRRAHRRYRRHGDHRPETRRRSAPPARRGGWSSRPIDLYAGDDGPLGGRTRRLSISRPSAAPATWCARSSRRAP